MVIKNIDKNSSKTPRLLTTCHWR